MIIDHRLRNSPTFTTRVVRLDQRKWWDWLAALRATQPGVSTSKLHFVAIRKKKMKACLKNDFVSLEQWLFDLIDGTAAANAHVLDDF
jgi:hypothetical protein